MPFRAKYSDEQRKALISACLDYGLSARRATMLANRGELPGAPDVPAFGGISPEYAAQLVREERQRRGAEESAASSPETIMRKTLGMLAYRLDEQVRRLERRRNPPTAGEIADLAKAGREVAALARTVHGLPQAPTKPKADTNGHGDDPAGDFIGALARGESGA
jgi:hypothetical protein